jgi:CHAT domain-containing protein
VVAEESVAVFVITSGSIRARAVALPRTDLEAKIELLRDLLVRPESAEWRAPAASLARSLVAPFEESGWLDGIERLYVVPHGILHYLPFAVLARGATDSGALLIEDYLLAYLPSAAALAHGREEDAPEGTLLALAPRRSRLRYASEEVEGLTEFFPERRLVLTGDRATEGAFKGEAEGYRVVHLATHGTFNRHNPLLSGLELEPGAGEDGRLEVHEILGLRLAAELVTLSACETALATGYFAEIPAGDDFVGLTRAFLFAGSASVAASLWVVDDRSTLEFMQSFYRHLDGVRKAEALALAQRELYRDQGRYGHPYYWAPFVLVGAME